MIRAQLRPVSLQEKSIILRPTSFTGVQTGVQGIAAQAIQHQYQPTIQSYQVPVTTSANVAWTQPIATQSALAQQNFGQSSVVQWQTLQPAVYAQAYGPMVYQQTFQPVTLGQFTQPAMGVSYAGQVGAISSGINVVHGIAHNILQPNIDISETNSEVVVTYDLPLVDQNNLNISVGHDSVTLQADSQQGVFYRTVTLPTDVSPETCEAILTNDILEIRLPKISQNRRKININQTAE